ncbi:MlaA family lipoprotein [Vibrio palustris]|uniref:Putative phospholipid-binding lipoprotein MlaA n=1 Tax=Vibrio palustris TaxID=1918946 RepID=A0A1R4B0H9_9VIBR|nr:VacJ family lipoprotein [Vibrio palustris]SJL82411.1 putative phospholipid-binding lipoprotein MlaA precursor [Vibrio palustris]
MINRFIYTAFLGVLLILTGCSSTPSDEQASTHSDVSDPLEGFNRTMWDFNYNYLDPYILRPTSVAYVDYVPSPVRSGISNFFGNLDEPSSMVNNIIMGNGKQAVNHFNRFWINSTFGILGLFDVASAAGISKESDREFGDAIGYYGVGKGPYIMVPGAGPYALRESTDFVDSSYFPLSYINIWASLGKFIFQGLDSRAELISQEPMLNDSPDPYLFTRDAYMQHLDFKAEVKKDDYNAAEEAKMDDYLDQY